MDDIEVRAVLAFVGQAAYELRRLDAGIWRERLEARYHDIEAAFEWFLDHRTADALAMASLLAEFMRISGRATLGRSWLDRALQVAAADDPLRAKALYDEGLLAFWQGSDAEARALHESSLELARQREDQSMTAQALCGLARLVLTEDVERARALCEEALATVKGSDEHLGRSNALHVLGVAAQMVGDLQQARDFMMQRIELARELGDVAQIGSESSNLSMVERQLGNLERAEELAIESLQLEARRGDEWAIPYTLNGLAAIAVETGAFERAATLLAAAATLQERQENAWPPDEAPHFERSRAAVTEGLDHEQLERAWSSGERMSLADAVQYALAPARPDIPTGKCQMTG
jgi:tetratricopeptide (TPR) repeat protein